MTGDSDIRWKQRFANYDRAFQLLDDALATSLDDLNMLEKEGTIQRFEYTLELAWKVLKDKMMADGLLLDQISPKAVIRKAFGAKYIFDSELWLQMIGDRNLLSHTYSFETFEDVLRRVSTIYLPLLRQLYESLKTEIS
jgi:nucleotidyltransferase substrate binding protein (TIGR01987 family)